MVELPELLVAVLVLYGVECLLSVRRDALVFFSIGGGFRPRLALDLPGPAGRGFLLGMPLPPLGSVFVTQFWPLSLDPYGVSSAAVQRLGTPPRERPAEFVPFEQITHVHAEDDAIVVNGRVLARAASPALARHLAAFLRELRPLSAEQRGPRIEQALRTQFCQADAAQALAQLRAHSLPVRWCSNGLFAAAFILAPGLAWRYGLAGSWALILAAVLICWLLAALAYWRAHRRLDPADGPERRRRGITLLLTPLAAIRACDALARDALARFHPLAAAAVLCDDAALRRLGEDVLRDLASPPVPPEAGDPRPAAAADWLRQRLRGETEALLRARGMAPAALLADPPPEDERCRAYCPRCGAQYVEPPAECPHCPGVRLRPLAARPAEAAAPTPAGGSATR